MKYCSASVRISATSEKANFHRIIRAEVKTEYQLVNINFRSNAKKILKMRTSICVQRQNMRRERKKERMCTKIQLHNSPQTYTQNAFWTFELIQLPPTYMHIHGLKHRITVRQQKHHGCIKQVTVFQNQQVFITINQTKKYAASSVAQKVK